MLGEFNLFSDYILYSDIEHLDGYTYKIKMYICSNLDVKSFVKIKNKLKHSVLKSKKIKVKI